MRRYALPAILIAVLGLWTCSSGEPASETAAAPEKKPAEQIRDETHKFHKDGLVSARVVEDQLGGKDFMPGGNFAAYAKDGKEYSVFFTERRNADQAMFLSMDYRDALTDPKFIPSFGGFFGMDGDVPTMVFQKDKYVVGVTGLDLEDADQAARLIAGYLN